MGLPEPEREPRDPDPARGSGSTRPTSKVVVGLLSVITVILTAWALKASAVVTMPLAFAFFVAILVHPIERSLAARLPGGWSGSASPARCSPSSARWRSRVRSSRSRSSRWWRGRRSTPTSCRGNGTACAPGPAVRARAAARPATSGAARQQRHAAAGLGSQFGGRGAGVPALVFFFTLLMLIEASSWRRKTEVALRRRQTAAVLETVPAVAQGALVHADPHRRRA